MPRSRRRKKQVAANRRQIEKARRRLEGQRAREKENRLQECSGSSSSALELPAVSSGEENDERGWLGGFYNWCYSGFTQVALIRVFIPELGFKPTSSEQAVASK